MQHAELDRLLADFEQRLMASPSSEALTQLAFELNSSLKIYDGCGWLGGSVIALNIAQAYAPRFNDIAERVAKLEAKGKKKVPSARSRHKVTLTLIFKAELRNSETQKRVTTPALLAACQGKKDETDWDGIDFGEIPVLPLPVYAVLNVDKTTNKLQLLGALPLEREPTKAEIRTIVSLVGNRNFHGWGLNCEFELPAKLNDYNVQFDAEPVGWRLSTEGPARAKPKKMRTKAATKVKAKAATALPKRSR